MGKNSLVFGCEGIWKPHGKVIILHNPPDMMRILNIQYVDGRFVTTGAPAKAIEIIGRTITLSDVLYTSHTIAASNFHYAFTKADNKIISLWNLADDNLDNASEECKDLILKILS